jgi:hypothetical protein
MWYTEMNTKCCKKWVEDKWNERMLKRTNNQAPVVGLAQEWICAHTTSERTSIKNEKKSYSCSSSIKEDYILGLHY